MTFMSVLGSFPFPCQASLFTHDNSQFQTAPWLLCIQQHIHLFGFDSPWAYTFVGFLSPSLLFFFLFAYRTRPQLLRFNPFMPEVANLFCEKSGLGDDLSSQIKITPHT